MEIFGALLVNLLTVGFEIAVFVAVLWVAIEAANASSRQERALLHGVEVEAEVLGRFEAGAREGSERAKARIPQMASWDPRELELRYVFQGKEIVSRCRVSIDTFYRTRSKKILRIKVDPQHPEQWAALA